MRAIAIAAGLAAAAAGLAFAAPAQADEYDYVSELDGAGVYYSSINDVIDQGKLACRIMRQGISPRAAVDYSITAGYSAAEAVWIVTAAATHMCVDQRLKVQDATNFSHY